MGLSKPAEPPKPTVNELVTICAYICFFGIILDFFATAYKICDVPFSIVPPKSRFITNNVNRIPTIGKTLLMKLNFKIPLISVANENTECAKLFKIITATADEIPTNTLDMKMNCFSVSFDCAQPTADSNLYTILFSIVFSKVRNYFYYIVISIFLWLLFCSTVSNRCYLQNSVPNPDLRFRILLKPSQLPFG